LGKYSTYIVLLELLTGLRKGSVHCSCIVSVRCGVSPKFTTVCWQQTTPLLLLCATELLEWNWNFHCSTFCISIQY